MKSLSLAAVDMPLIGPVPAQGAPTQSTAGYSNSCLDYEKREEEFNRCDAG